jgi:hypothetical protein
MSDVPTAPLQATSRRLLDVLRAGHDEALPALLAERQGQIQAVVAAVSAGERIAPEAVREVEALEREVVTAMRGRREALLQELAALRRGRRVGTAYHSAGEAVARFVDQER